MELRNNSSGEVSKRGRGKVGAFERKKKPSLPFLLSLHSPFLFDSIRAPKFFSPSPLFLLFDQLLPQLSDFKRVQREEKSRIKIFT